MNILNSIFNKKVEMTAKTKAENSSSLDSLMPFGIALSLLVFAFIPGSAKAASTTYYVDIPNLGSYGAGAVSYICNGANCSVNGSGNGYGTGSASRPSTAPASQYPNYAYQYYKNPNGLSGSASGSGSNGGSTAAPYVQQKASYVPYNFPTYVQYVKQSDGTYKLNSQKNPPAYAWNADNSLPSSVTGSASNPSSGAGYSGSAGRGFTMTSSGN